MPETNTPVQTINEPFAPEVLHKAGIPCEDVIWFSRLPSNLKMVAVRREPRGINILSRLREHFAANQAPQQLPMAA